MTRKVYCRYPRLAQSAYALDPDSVATALRQKKRVFADSLVSTFVDPYARYEVFVTSQALPLAPGEGTWEVDFESNNASSGGYDKSETLIGAER
jgi:hypothetical protein